MPSLFFSLEFFPPKTEAGVMNLFERMDRFATLGPLWIDVTWGAGGSTAKQSIDICETAFKYHALEPMLHLTCTNLNLECLDETLLRCHRAGIQNILALRGDAPMNSNKWEASDSGFYHAVDLVRYIRNKYGDHFCIAVAGYPEGHIENPDINEDLKFLKEKVDAGADLIITQLFYDVDVFINFVAECRKMGITVPIIPGIMPIQSYNGFLRFVEFCKTKVPPAILNAIELIKDNEQKIKDYGVELATKMCKQIIDAKCASGLHFYTLNLEVSVMRIVRDGLSLTDDHKATRVLPWKRSASGGRRGSEEIRPIFWSLRPKSYISRTDGWDDFPNGRWGKRESPAYGEPYLVYRGDKSEKGNDLKRKMWGESIKSVTDVCEVFVAFLQRNESCKRLPWCPDLLADETSIITKQLIKLNRLGLCTINSQPRVNGANSTDPYFGWGPANGFVYQKAYIEFFCSRYVLDGMLDALNHKENNFSFTASNVTGEVFSNSTPGSVNAVTWGVFPDREIIQPTVVDFDSFLVWKDEAFELWPMEWGSIYPADSAARKVIDEIHDTWFLVNVVENNFLSGRLFEVLTEVATKIQVASTNGHDKNGVLA